MKSAAFNLAFKVHRNELSFPEGLLQSVEADAQQDFIEALNSLAGEVKYDAIDLQRLIEEAQRSLGTGEEIPEFNQENLEQEIEDLLNKRKEILDSVRTLEHQISALAPKIVPGVNSLLLFLVGGVVSIVLFMAGAAVPAMVIAIVAVPGTGYLYFQDLNTYSKQKAEVERKKDRIRKDVDQLKFQVSTINQEISKKRETVRQIKEFRTIPSERKPADRQPAEPQPDSNDLPSLLDL
ncbi:MAG: hypothetical protein ACOX5R_06890 [bacterium]|jgi:peptidoglycan hydrolase CwlO-like protein